MTPVLTCSSGTPDRTPYLSVIGYIVGPGPDLVVCCLCCVQ